MNLAEKIKALSDTYLPYIRKFSYGVAFPFATKTSWRKGLEGDQDLLQFYKNRSGFNDDENFRDYFIASSRRDFAYPVGMAVGLFGIVRGLLEYSKTQIKSEVDATVLLATLGALTAGNIASVLYERRRDSKHKDIFDIDIQNF